MKRVILGLALSFAMSGCGSVGRYQLGKPFTSPGRPNTNMIPTVDTQTGRLWIWTADSTPRRPIRASDWKLLDLGDRHIAADR